MRKCTLCLLEQHYVRKGFYMFYVFFLCFQVISSTLKMATSSSAAELSQLPPCICGKPITEEISVNPGNTASVTWSQKHTDFALVLKSGQELKCHKFVLAESSSFFDTMLNQQQFAETATARMKVEHLEEETVYSFLEYLYANKVAGEETVRQIRASVGPNQYIYKRDFSNKAKLTLDLLKVAHMYEVKDLVKDCSEHLRSTLCDHNVIERFLLADKTQVGRLRQGAMNYLIERASKTSINGIPGFKTAFDSNQRPLRDLLAAMSSQKNKVTAKLDKTKAKLDKVKAKLELRDKKNAELKKKLAEEKKKIEQLMMMNG